VTRTLVIGRDLIMAVAASAQRSYPDECCGLIEGAVTGEGWHALAIHEARNLAGDPARRFLIDPEVQFRLLRGLRGTERNIIGCFHSHPNGTARPSEHDRASAAEDGFLWLIASAHEHEAPDIAAFVFNAAAGGFEPVAISRSG
jgi:proteasome lid subunit RPN8/RPN11